MKTSITIAWIVLIHSAFCSAEPLDNWTKSRIFTNAVARVTQQQGVLFVSTQTTLFAATNLTANPVPVLEAEAADVAFGNGTFVAVGKQTVATSTDGFKWTKRTLGTDFYIRSVAFGAGRFVAVGDPGMAWVSENGIDWAAVSAPELGSNMRRILFGSGKFKAVGAQGRIASSTDGTEWNSENSGVIIALANVALGDDKWVAVGDAGGVLFAVGDAWTAASPFTSGWVMGVAFAGDTFVAVGTDTLIWTSRSGTTFLGRDTAGKHRLQSVCFFDGRFVAGGQDGLIYSDPLEVPFEPEAPLLDVALYPGVLIKGLPGFSYDIECAASADGPWTKVGALSLQEANQVWIDPMPAARPALLYRAVLSKR